MPVGLKSVGGHRAVAPNAPDSIDEPSPRRTRAAAGVADHVERVGSGTKTAAKAAASRADGAATSRRDGGGDVGESLSDQAVQLSNTLSLLGPALRVAGTPAAFIKEAKAAVQRDFAAYRSRLTAMLARRGIAWEEVSFPNASLAAFDLPQTVIRVLPGNGNRLSRLARGLEREWGAKLTADPLATSLLHGVAAYLPESKTVVPNAAALLHERPNAVETTSLQHEILHAMFAATRDGHAFAGRSPPVHARGFVDGSSHGFQTFEELITYGMSARLLAPVVLRAFDAPDDGEAALALDTQVVNLRRAADAVCNLANAFLPRLRRQRPKWLHEGHQSFLELRLDPHRYVRLFVPADHRGRARRDPAAYMRTMLTASKQLAEFNRGYFANFSLKSRSEVERTLGFVAAQRQFIESLYA